MTMTRSESVVVVIRSTIVGLALVASGCHADVSTHRLSDRYSVCARLPAGVAFSRQAPGPDFDLGVLRIEGTAIEVMMGGHPRFGRSAIKQGAQAKAGFEVLGRERSDDLDKILLAHERGEERGPMFVLFQAPRIGASEQRVLTTKGFLHDCD